MLCLPPSGLSQQPPHSPQAPPTKLHHRDVTTTPLTSHQPRQGSLRAKPVRHAPGQTDKQPRGSLLGQLASPSPVGSSHWAPGCLQQGGEALDVGMAEHLASFCHREQQGWGQRGCTATHGAPLSGTHSPSEGHAKIKGKSASCFVARHPTEIMKVLYIQTARVPQLPRLLKQHNGRSFKNTSLASERSR